MAEVIICSDFGAQKIKSDTVSTVSPSISYEVMGPDAMILVFWMLSFKPTFSLSSFTFIYIYICEVKWGEVKWLSPVQLFVTPWTVAYQAPPSMEFSRQQYWSGLPFPSSGGCVCIYIYICVCVCVCVCVHKHTHTHTHSVEYYHRNFSLIVSVTI